MPGGKIVSAPDGTRWRVRRRWLDRPAPQPWTRGRRRRSADDDGEALGTWGMEALLQGADSPSALAFGAVLLVLGVVLVLVLLPLLGIALELALLLVVLGASLFGRVVLRRPWTIEAVAVEDPTRRSAYAVTGWRRSRRALATLAAAIETTGPPAALPEAEGGLAGCRA